MRWNDARKLVPEKFTDGSTISNVMFCGPKNLESLPYTMYTPRLTSCSLTSPSVSHVCQSHFLPVIYKRMRIPRPLSINPSLRSDLAGL